MKTKIINFSDLDDNLSLSAKDYIEENEDDTTKGGKDD